jgi:uroporphyrinogen decarboxylase
MKVPLASPQPDYERFRRSVTRDGRPDRLAAGEQHADREIMAAVLGKDPADWRSADLVEYQWRMGYDYVNVALAPGEVFGPQHEMRVAEANPQSRRKERTFVNEQSGPVQNWADFEAFRWPGPEEVDFSTFDLFRPLLPKGMKMNALVPCGYFSKVTWTVGLQPFCYLLVDDRPLVKAIFAKWAAWVIEVSRRGMDVPGVGAYWLTDDLGFNTGPFLSPADLREFVFPVFAELGRMARARGLPFILHSCGNLNSILGDLVECDVHCFHSLPPALYDLGRLKREWGHKLAFCGNVDLNILGLGTAEQTRRAVRDVRRVWAEEPAGGILLSSSNSIANYCKLENYLAMMDEMLS